MYYENNQLYIDKDDQCETCTHTKDKVNCPLIQALAYEVVLLPDDTKVTNCALYQKPERKLRLIKNDNN